MSEPVVWLTIFVLSVFVGIEVISKVSSTLHTPLMSGANAIHGVILLGAIIVSAHASGVALAVGLVAIVLAAVNMVGGFVVTDRMLQMFSARSPAARPQRRRPPRDPHLGAAGLPGLRGRVHPRPQGALRAAYRPCRQPASAPPRRWSPCALPFFDLEMDNLVLILVAIAVGTAGGVSARAGSR